MDENLLGYLLKSLDVDSQREVESYLRSHPAERTHLERLRAALAPLASDPDEEPPPGLRVRTLARIAEYHCHKLPAAPPPEAAQILEAPIRGSWRWADFLVAASILLCLLTLVPLLTARVWRQYQQYACANNLHKFHTALVRYSDNHGGAFPKVDLQGARSVAGIFVPILHDEGVLDKDVSLSCSSITSRPPSNRSVQELEDLYWERKDEFRELSRGLSGCYAYTLGYWDGGVLRGLHRDAGDRVPVMADCPPVGSALFGADNSPNHGGKGQNVLFSDGSVTFCTTRSVGLGGDDIYLNQNNRQAAGLNPRDSVLGPSASSPWPRDEE
jgi:hypothetical protein